MGDTSPGRRRQVVPLEPRQLGLGEVFYRTREAVVVAEAASGRIVMWNDAAVRLFGHSEDEAVGLLVEDLVPDNLKERHRSGLARFAREGRGDLIDSGSPVELPAVHRDGTELWVEMSLTPMAEDVLPGRYAMAIVRDVTERKHLEDEVRATREGLAASVEQLERRTRELTLITELADRLHVCTTAGEVGDAVSDVAGRLFPMTSGGLYQLDLPRDGFDVHSTWGDAAPRDHSLTPEDCWALRRGRTHIVDTPISDPACAHAQGAGRYLCVPMVAQGEVVGLLHVRAPDGPTTQMLNAELAVAVAGHLALALANFDLRERLRDQSIRDSLTDLYNRRYMEELMEREVRRAGRHGLHLSVIAMDIDHFKAFNDAHGHEAGDSLLRELATFFSSQVRGEDVVCRLGGEEFLAILPYAGLAQAGTRAEELRVGAKEISILPHRATTEHAVTISFGVAAFPEHGSTPAQLLRAADAALYRAKAQGRDRVVLAERSD